MMDYDGSAANHAVIMSLHEDQVRREPGVAQVTGIVANRFAPLADRGLAKAADRERQIASGKASRTRPRSVAEAFSSQ